MGWVAAVTFGSISKDTMDEQRTKFVSKRKYLSNALWMSMEAECR